MRPLGILAAGLFILCLALAASGILRFPAAGNKASGMNVILVSVDSLRADHMGAYGYARATTPNFDAFAKEGTLFENYFSTSFLTPVSEASVHTGLFPIENGVTNFDTALPESIPTLAQFLEGHGYATRALISSPEFIGNVALKESFSRGFAAYEEIEGSASVGPSLRNFPSDAELVSALDASAKERSFLWLALGGVHWPYGNGLEARFGDTAYAGPFKDQALDWNLFQYLYKGVRYPGGTPVTAADTAYVRDRYDDGVAAFDAFFGTLIKQLKERGMLERTIIIVESEHGEDLGEHGYFAHYDVLDTQTHVPLLIYVPGRAPARIDSLASGVDVFPTLANMLDLPAPAGMEGTDLFSSDAAPDAVFLERSPLWEEAHKGLRAALWNRDIPVESGKYRDIAIRTKEWKYIERLARERVERISWWAELTGAPITVPEAELYDLASDPGETKNVIADFPDEAKELRTRLETWYAKIRANAPSHIQQDEQVQPYF